MRRERADVLIVGGGVIGSSIALHLRRRAPAARVIVVERDPTYERASSRLATGGVRQQYGSPLNVAMARHSVLFYGAMDSQLAAVGHPGRIRFRQRGYLFLADDATADALEQRFAMLRAAGARVSRWSCDDVARTVPGLHCGDVRFGIFGPEDGYLEPREVLSGMRSLAASAGAEFVHGEVIAVDREAGRAAGAVCRTDAGETTFASPVVVNAAGAYAAGVGALARVDLPVRPVRQHLFRLELAKGLPSRIPMIFDPDGTHWRLDDDVVTGRADRIVIGRSRTDEPEGENFTCDRMRLDGEMLPTLRRRYTAANVTGVAESWTGLYEMTPDHNAILGEHPELPGFVTAAGFSGHGLMMAPATGLAVAELVDDAPRPTFDIAPLAPDRFVRGQPFHDAALL